MAHLLSVAQQRTRRFYTVLPLLLLPFLTLGFWALGGGRNAPPRDAPAGLNLELPAPHFKKGPEGSKLNFYEWSRRDSLKEVREEAPVAPSSPGSQGPAAVAYDPYPKETVTTEAVVVQKLTALEQQLQKGTLPERQTPALVSTTPAASPHTPAQTTDPELEQLSGMMDKILQIQQGGSASGALSQPPVRSKETPPASVLTPQGWSVSLLQPPALPPSGEEDKPSSREVLPQLRTEVVGTQVVTEGSFLRVRLLERAAFGEGSVPEGTPLLLQVSVQGDRLLLSLPQLWINGVLRTVALKGYDHDGWPGLAVRGLTKGGGRSPALLQEMEASLKDPTDATPQGTALRLGARELRALLTRKRKPLRVLVKGGLTFFLHP